MRPRGAGEDAVQHLAWQYIAHMESGWGFPAATAVQQRPMPDCVERQVCLLTHASDVPLAPHIPPGPSARSPITEI